MDSTLIIIALVALYRPGPLGSGMVDDFINRKHGADGKLPPVGNTVNVEKATWKNTIGTPELISVWTDPEFDASLSAFYYVRVIEIPTPRWTAYEALRFGVEMSSDVPMTIQERAYTSPIWYTTK